MKTYNHPYEFWQSQTGDNVDYHFNIYCDLISMHSWVCTSWRRRRRRCPPKYLARERLVSPRFYAWKVIVKRPRVPAFRSRSLMSVGPSAPWYSVVYFKAFYEPFSNWPWARRRVRASENFASDETTIRKRRRAGKTKCRQVFFWFFPHLKRVNPGKDVDAEASLPGCHYKYWH